MPANTQNKLLDLNAALQDVIAGVKGIDIKVKNATSTSVKYIVKSHDRQSTRDLLENQLNARKVGKVSRESISDSSMEVTRCVIRVGGKAETHTFVYKPIRGGMSQTTLNSSITELFPCIAFITGIKSNTVRNTKDFYEKIIANNSPSLGCYVNPRDAKAGKEFIEKAETGKFEEKVRNAINAM